MLAFGTNEGFNDELDVAAYSAQYEQIVRRLQDIRPGLRIVIDRAARRGARQRRLPRRGRRAGLRPNHGASQRDGGGQCRLPTPPKLAQVREAQRKLAERLGADFWDWSSRACPAPAARKSGPPPTRR